MTALPPGSTIGILGGGQLGRMLAIAAAQLGYRSHIYAPETSGPATEVSAEWTQAAYDDEHALRRFAERVSVVTYEFENISVSAVDYLSRFVPVRPGSDSLEFSRYRPLEKGLARKLGGKTAPFGVIEEPSDLQNALKEAGAPSILKTSSFGYDGKGQVRLNSAAELEAAWNTIGRAPAVLEGLVAFEAEFSVILCRGSDGETAIWDPPENTHVSGILDTSVVPARSIVLEQAPEAISLATRMAEDLDHVGVLTLEFFACANGPVFNEMAPRVHNSGHWTIEGAIASQFENHIRAICGLPLGATARTGARVEMKNLIGEAANDWPVILREPEAKLHLYGKHVRPGRKMGHVTRVWR